MLSTELHAFAQAAESEMFERVEQVCQNRDLKDSLKSAMADFEINKLGLSGNLAVIENVLEQFVQDRQLIYPVPTATVSVHTNDLERLRSELASILMKRERLTNLVDDISLDTSDLGDPISVEYPELGWTPNGENKRIAGSISFQLHAFNARMRDLAAELTEDAPTAIEYEVRKREATRTVVDEYRRELRDVLIQVLDLKLSSITAPIQTLFSKEPKSLAQLWKGKQVPLGHKLEVLCKVLQQQANNKQLWTRVREVLDPQ